jgi:hypothetical protein
MAFVEQKHGYAFSDIRHISPDTKEFQGFVLGLRSELSGAELLEGSLPVPKTEVVQEADPDLERLKQEVEDLKLEQADTQQMIKQATDDLDAVEKELGTRNKSIEDLEKDKVSLCGCPGRVRHNHKPRPCCANYYAAGIAGIVNPPHFPSAPITVRLAIAGGGLGVAEDALG